MGHSYTLKNKLRAVLLATSGFATGQNLAVFNPLGSPLLEIIYQKEAGLEVSVTLGYINLAYSAGYMLSMIVGTVLQNKLGRVNTHRFADLLGILVSLLFLIKNLPLLIFCRILAGLVSGRSLSSNSAILGEVFPSNIIGFGGTLTFIIIVNFQLVCFIQGLVLSREMLADYWRLILAWPLVMHAIRFTLVTFFIRFKTPVFIFESYKDSQKKIEQIAKTLKKIRKEENYEQAAAKIVRGIEEEKARVKVGLKQLWTNKKYWRRMASATLINCMLIFGGFIFMILFSTDFFNEVSGNGSLVTFLMGLCNNLFACVGLLTVNKLGRKFNMRLGLLGQILGLGLTIVGIVTEWHVFVALSVCLFMAGFGLGIGCLHILIPSEILPAKGINFAFFVRWALMMLAGAFMGVIAEEIGPVPLLAFFLLANFLALLTLNAILIETKNKSKEQIDEDYLNYGFDWIWGGVNKKDSEKGKIKPENKFNGVDGVNEAKGEGTERKFLYEKREVTE